jgi:hypothetical protein
MSGQVYWAAPLLMFYGSEAMTVSGIQVPLGRSPFPESVANEQHDGKKKKTRF